jgi:phospholipid transport system substrate-binding protein
MLSRRTFLLCSAAAAAALTTGLPAMAQAGDPTGFISNLANQMVAIVNGPGTLEQKRARMQPLIERDVDINQIAQFCLGRFWRTSTPEQQQRYMQLFHQVLLNEISSKLGEFQGVSYRTTSTTQREGDYFVGTIINRPNQQPNNVQWVVSLASGRPLLIDVVAEGTSLRLTKRSDYAAYLTRNGNNVDALLTAMQRQVGA